MEVGATTVPRSTPHQRRCITTAVARRINIAATTTPRRVITHRHPVTTSPHRVITRLARVPIIGRIRIRVGAIVGVMADAVMAATMATVAMAEAVIADRSEDKRRRKRRFFVRVNPQ